MTKTATKHQASDEIPDTEALGQRDEQSNVVPGSPEYRKHVSRLLRGALSYEEFMELLEPESAPQRHRLLRLLRTLTEGLAGRSFPSQNPPR